jgi:hypothetical protein
MMNMKKIVDADTHISESETMWALFDREMYKRRPVLVSVPDDTLYEERNAFWLIDGNIAPSTALTDRGAPMIRVKIPASQRSSDERYAGRPAGFRKLAFVGDEVKNSWEQWQPRIN